MLPACTALAAGTEARSFPTPCAVLQAPQPHPLFHKPLGTCDVTQYAAQYAAMTGRSPHMTRKAAGQ